MWTVPPPRYGRWQSRFAALVGAAVSAVIVVLASGGLYTHYAFATRGVETQATIVASFGTGADRQYVVRFTTPDGTEVETFTTTRRSDKPVGDRTTIVYDRTAPEYAQEVTGEPWFVEPAAFAAVGLLIAGGTVWQYRWWKRWNPTLP